MATQMSNDNYCVIFGWMCNGLNLNSNELLVYAVIYGFSQDGESRFYGGRGFLARTLNISKPTVDKALKSLCDKGFIHRVITERNGVVFHEYYADLQVVNNLYHPEEDNDTNKDSLYSNKVILPNNKDSLPSNKDSLPNIKDISNTKEISNKGNNKGCIDFISILDSVDFIRNDSRLRQDFIDFIENRKAMNKAFKTETALKRCVNEVYKLGNGDPNIMHLVLDQSIQRNYQGVFPVKTDLVRTSTTVHPDNSNPFTRIRKEEGF